MQKIRVCARIHTGAIVNNFNEIRKHIDKSVKLMPVVKADGYGHGALVFAKLLENQTDYFAVATVDEAMDLRKNGIKNPILVLGHTFSDEQKEAIQNDITLTVTSCEDAASVFEEAQALDKTATVHIALDTGMGRIGFIPDKKTADEVKKISKLSNLNIEGVFTHFSTADEADFSFTKVQADRFCAFRKMLEERNVEIKLYHASNSGAIMQHCDFHFDMARAGIILYGLYPSDEVDKSVLELKPVMEVVSHVAFVKTVNEGDSISYGRTFIAEKEMKIATIPVGYADGYPRVLSNKGRVIINGQYAPIVGRICMDQFMVDVSQIENVNVGDEVVLIGSQGDKTVSVDEIAALAGTINYEIVCGISKRVPREVVE